MFWLIPQKVIWIIFSHNLHKTIAILSIGRFDSIHCLVHQQVYISAVQTISRNSQWNRCDAVQPGP